jgi:protein phosphatase 2C
LTLSVQVANYCRDKIHVVLRDVLGAGEGLGEVGEVDVKEPWEKVFGDCFQKVDDEVSGNASMFSSEPRAEPVAADNVGSTAVVAVVCSSHVIAANCGDSRVVLCRGKEPIALSVDHKVRTGIYRSTKFVGKVITESVSDYASLFQPDRKDERTRIEAAGGKVIDWNGYRVSGILAMSRSIGKFSAFACPCLLYGRKH